MHPEIVNNRAGAGLLDILWRDGMSQQLSHGFLRSQCQCAFCRVARLRSNTILPVVAETRITAIQPVGNYGVQFIFSDGHQRGIFPWIFIRNLEDQQLFDANSIQRSGVGAGTG
jgi:DUF971 family protein